MKNQEIINIIKKKYAEKNLKQPHPNWPNDVKRALTCLNQNIFDRNFSVTTMRHICRIPQKNFSSRFKSYLGYTPASYLKFHRIQCSKEIIFQIGNNFSISTIGFEVGYEYPSTFSNAFKSIERINPKLYWKISKKK